MPAYNNLDNLKLKRFLEINSKNKTLPKYEEHYKKLFKEIELYLEKLDRIEKNSDPNIYKFDDLLKYFYLYNEKINVILHFREEASNEDWIKVRSKNIDELLEIANNWERSFTKSSLTSYETNDIVYGPVWKDSSFNGHVIVRLTTKNDLILEGKLLNHCVGGYYDLVESGDCNIYSLRNPSNKPLVTIETSPDLIEFKQEYGYKNSQPNNIQKDMIKEWKNQLHPPDDILNLFYNQNTGDLQNKIQALSYMDYSIKEYKGVIDDIIKNYDKTDNYVLIVACLSKNKYLPESYYDKIYEYYGQEFDKNHNKVYNNLLEISDSLSNYLFRKIIKENYNDFTYNSIYMVASCRKIGLEENNDILEMLLKDNLDKFLFFNQNTINLILNNNSIKSSKIISILNTLSIDSIINIFDEGINNFDSKLIDNMLDSKNDLIFYKSILTVNNINLTKKVLDKIAKKFNVKFYTDKNDLIEQIIKNSLNNYSLLSQFSDNPKFGYLPENFLSAPLNEDITKIIQKYNLTFEQVDYIMSNLKDLPQAIIDDITYYITYYQDSNFIKNDIIFNKILNYVSKNSFDNFIKNISNIFKKEIPDNYLKLICSKIVANKFNLNQSFQNYFLALNISDDLINFIEKLENIDEHYFILFIQLLIKNPNVNQEKIKYFYNKLQDINDIKNPNKIIYSLLETPLEDIIVSNNNISSEEIFKIFKEAENNKKDLSRYYSLLLKNKNLAAEIIDYIINKFVNDEFYSYDIFLMLKMKNISNDQIKKIFDYLLKNTYKYKDLHSQVFKIWDSMYHTQLSNETLSLIKSFLKEISNKQAYLSYIKKINVNQARTQILSNDDFLNFINEINNNNEEEDDDYEEEDDDYEEEEDDDYEQNADYTLQLKYALEGNKKLTLEQCIILIQNNMKPEAITNYHIKIDKTSSYIINKIAKLANKLFQTIENINNSPG